MHELTPEQHEAFRQTVEQFRREREAFELLPKEEQIRIRQVERQKLLQSLSWGRGLRKLPHPKLWPYYPCTANGLPI
jgi:hypothetical protein